MNHFISFVNSLKDGKIAPVYFFYGKEIFLIERAVNKLKEAMLNYTVSEFNVGILDGNDVPTGQILAQARTFPFMAQKRLLIVKNAFFFESAKKTQGNTLQSEQALIEYLDSPAPFTCLAFTMQNSPDKRKKIYKRLVKNGIAIDFKPLGRDDILKWLAFEARAEGKRLDVKAGNELLLRAGTSLKTLENELGKVISYIGSGDKITLKEVCAVVSGSLESNVFEMVDALGEGNYVGALKKTRELLLNKEPPQVILSLIARQFRLILAFNETPKGLSHQKEVEKRLKLHPYVARKIQAQSKNFTQEKCRYALKELLEIDIAVKSGRQDFYPAVETMAVHLASFTK